MFAPSRGLLRLFGQAVKALSHKTITNPNPKPNPNIVVISPHHRQLGPKVFEN